MKKNILREKMEKGEYIIGTQMFMGSKYCAEIMGNLDYDFIFVCAEHTPMGTDNIYDIVKTLEYSGTPSLVRLPIFDLTYTKKVLDMGASAVLFPMVRSAKEAKEAIDACLYPPYGTRGFGPMGAIKWGIESEPEFVRNNLQGAVRMIQIEHIDAVRDIDEILKIPYLDGVVFGPNDLASSMGHICDMYNDDVQEVIKETIKKIKKKKKTIGVSLVTNDMKKIEYWKKLGVTFFSIGSDASFILNSAKELYKNLETVIQK